MKKSLILISSALLLIAGCAKEQLVEPSVQNGYDGPVTIVGAAYEQFAADGETKASFGENGQFGWIANESAAFEVTGSTSWYSANASDISDDKSKCSFVIAGDLSDDMVAVLPADINPARYTAQSSNDGLKVTLPASRTWAKDQSYATMLGFGAKSGNNISYSFSHLGGLAKIKVNGVPSTARKFVFKTEGYKISGDFQAGKLDKSSKQTITTTAASNDATATDDFTEDEETYSLTFTSDDITNNNGTMEFNVPLPCGTYSNGFAFCFKDGSGTVIYNFSGSTPKKVDRTDRIILPTINIVGGGGEGSPTKSVQNIPAGYKGDFLLAEAENVLLKIASEANANDINLKYNSGQKPSNLEINIVDGETVGTFAGTISGILPDTHVDFTKGTIANVSMTTSTSTFEIIYPATISTKLTVTGGNVKIKGAEVKAIEVAQNAVASEETKAPVQISMEKYTPTGGSEQTPKVTEKIEANADVVVAPEKGVTVTVDAGDNVQVANEGAGTVKDKSDQPIETKAAAKIGEVKYITLADAIAAVKDGETIKLVADVEKAAGMSLDTKKTFTVDFGGHTYTVNKPGAGSTNTQTLAFQLLKDQTITFKNGTIKAATENLNATESDGKKPIKRFIQNYANLTLTDMTLDGTNINGNNSVVEFCNGTVTVNGSTNFTAKSGVATINVDSWTDYPKGTAVTINTTGNVGKIHCYAEGDGSMTTNSSLTIKNGKNISIDDASNGKVTISVEGGELVGPPVGALKGEFSVSPTKKVHFSQGNLTYNVSTTTWAFYEHQYDCATGYDADLISLFTWGYNINTSTDPDGESYVTGHASVPEHPEDTEAWESFSASEDWGSQIGDGKTWRTLTAAEWQYLFNTREASTVSGTQNARYAKATVGSISGIILLPDKYEHPSGVAALTNINTSDAGYTANSYDVTTWAAMEDAGAVFLPAADYREGDEVDYGNTFGSYWSSTACRAEYAYCVEFDSTNSNVDPENNYLDPEYVDERAYGCSVRLVTESN